MDTHELADRYVAVWNEPDAELRREAIRALWAEDGAHALRAPQDVVDRALDLGFTSTVLAARGHAEIERRIGRAHQNFVSSGDFTFRSRGDADRIDDVVTFAWEMVPSGGGGVAAVGREVLVLGEDGRITADYQFIER